MSAGSRWIGAIAAFAATAMMVAALWAWRDALWLSAGATRPEVACWAFRSAAVAAASGAQLVFLTFVVRRSFMSVPGQDVSSRRDEGRRLLDSVLRLTVGVIGSIALVSAIALGLAGR